MLFEKFPKFYLEALLKSNVIQKKQKNLFDSYFLQSTDSHQCHGIIIKIEVYNVSENTAFSKAIALKLQNTSKSLRRLIKNTTAAPILHHPFRLSRSGASQDFAFLTGSKEMLTLFLQELQKTLSELVSVNTTEGVINNKMNLA